MEIQTVVSLLTLASPEARLIGYLNNCFKFDHNLFLLESSADINNFVTTGNQPKSFFVFESDKGWVTGLESLQRIESKNTLVVIAPDSSIFDRNLNLLKQIKKYERLATNVKIGIFFQDTASMNDLKSHFLWFKDQLVAHVFAAAYNNGSRSLNIFAFHPFGKFEVINVTSRNTCEEIFPSLDSNCHQHTFRVSPFPSNIFERFWLSAFEVMNATFTVENVWYKTAREYFQNGIDIHPRLAAITLKSSSFPLYPLILSNTNIVVPEAEPYSGFYAYLQILTTNEFFAYIGGAMAAIVLMLSVCRYIKVKNILLVQSFLDVLNLLMNDNSFINYQRLSRAEMFLIGPLTFVGFIVVNGYLSNLQSYMTRPFLQPQLRTVADIYNSPLTISAPPQLVDLLVERVTYGSGHKDWSNKILTVENERFRAQLTDFNTSTSYLVVDLDFSLLSTVQRRLNIRGFYDTGVTVLFTPCTFPASERFLFFDKLNEVVHRTHSSGLLRQWMKESDAEKEGIFVAYNQYRSPQTADDFQFPLLIVYGWAISAIVLIVEIMWAKIKSRLSTG